MHLDVVDLRKFYERTPLGHVAKIALRQAVRTIWPDVRGMSMVGFGYASPLLRPFRQEASRLLSLMPAPQGISRWPSDSPNQAALVEETLWPINTGYIDRLLVAHGLETCERPQALLDECWRALAPGGKAIFVVPNRSGLWTRRDVTPFGYGRPYSFGQLEKQLRNHMFEPGRHAAALYTPPSHKRFWLKSSGLCEKIGLKVDAQRLAGVILIEATKLVYASPQSGAKSSVRTPLEVLEGLTGGRPKPVVGRHGRDTRN